MASFYKPPSKNWKKGHSLDDEDEDEDEDSLLDALRGADDDEDEVDDEGDDDEEEDEEDILDAIRKGEYKPKKKDPWTWHCLYSTCRDLESLSRDTHDFSRRKNKKKKN
jgi:hypothetical protein